MANYLNGQALAAAISLAGYTKARFAALLGVNRRTVYFYIEGERNPGLARLIKMAGILRVQVKDLLRPVNGAAEE